MQYKLSPSFSVPVIDVEATSQNLKRLREENHIKISRIQKLLNMAYPQAIYNWENPNDKTLPCLDHLVALAKLYKISLDEIIIIKEETKDAQEIYEPKPTYGITQETLDFIALNANKETKLALTSFYAFSVLN